MTCTRARGRECAVWFLPHSLFHTIILHRIMKFTLIFPPPPAMERQKHMAVHRGRGLNNKMPTRPFEDELPYKTVHYGKYTFHSKDGFTFSQELRSLSEKSRAKSFCISPMPLCVLSGKMIVLFCMHGINFE